jgi:hypothetical protein
VVGIAGVAACAPIAEFGGDQMFFRAKKIVIGTARRKAISRRPNHSALWRRLTFESYTPPAPVFRL